MDSADLINDLSLTVFLVDNWVGWGVQVRLHTHNFDTTNNLPNIDTTDKKMCSQTAR